MNANLELTIVLQIPNARTSHVGHSPVNVKKDFSQYGKMGNSLATVRITN